MDWYSLGSASGGAYFSGYVLNAPISTFPDDTVRCGSIYVKIGIRAYDDSDPWILELLILELCGYIDAR